MNQLLRNSVRLLLKAFISKAAQAQLDAINLLIERKIEMYEQEKTMTVGSTQQERKEECQQN